MKNKYYKAWHITCFLLLCFTSNIFANGGPVDYSLFRKTQNIKLINKADIKLVSEDLNITIEGDYSIIKVKYELKNLGKSQQICYGFPIDAFHDVWGSPGGTGVVFDGFHPKSKLINYFKAFANSEPIKSTYFDVDSVYSITLNNYDPMYNPFIIQRRWYILKIDFEKNETQELVIDYKIRNRFQDYTHGFRFVDRYYERNFTYHLTPSSNWGDGIVENFSVSINFDDLEKNKVPYSITGINDLAKTSNTYSLKRKNYDLKKSDRINITYNNEHLKLSDFIARRHIPRNMIKSIKASSNSDSAINLIDNNPNTVWVGKKGDWIEIEFYKYKNERDRIRFDSTNLYIWIKGVLALNGDYSSVNKFKRSNLAKELLVSYNYNREFRPLNGEYGKLIKLPFKENLNLNKKDIKGNSTTLAEGIGFYFHEYDHIWKIRINVADIYRQNKNDSFTLSELYFLY